MKNKFMSVFLAFTLTVSFFCFVLPQNISANTETNEEQIQSIEEVPSNEIMTRGPVPFANFPVSNYTQLVAALTLANDGDTIEISNSITLSATLTVTKELTFKSVASGPIELTVSGGFRHMNIATAEVTFDGVELVGTTSTISGGLQLIAPSVTLNNPIIRNCNSAGDGGAIEAISNVTIIGGEISNNTAGTQGGGIYANDVYVSSTIIRNNTAATDGGGIYSHTFDVTVDGGARIENNTATIGSGGGIYATQDTFLHSGSINNNTASMVMVVVSIHIGIQPLLTLLKSVAMKPLQEEVSLLMEQLLCQQGISIRIKQLEVTVVVYSPGGR